MKKNLHAICLILWLAMLAASFMARFISNSRINYPIDNAEVTWNDNTAWLRINGKTITYKWEEE